MSLTAEDRDRAQVVADQLGARTWLNVVFLVLAGELAEMEGRLDDNGRRMLYALRDSIQPTGRPAGNSRQISPPRGEIPA
jgi:hypothetical protein